MELKFNWRPFRKKSKKKSEHGLEAVRPTAQLRDRLPTEMIARNVSVWGMLRHFIGHDLSTISIPIALNEPLSFLQRIAEQLEYIELLRKASQQEDPFNRMKYVAAFAISCYASNYDRLGKPFNPLLGETYELQRDGYRAVFEQVLHHPPVSAFHCESESFSFFGSIRPSLKFKGRYIECINIGSLTVTFPRYNESYIWDPADVFTHVRNVIFGKMWFDLQGFINIRNVNTGYMAKINFIPTIPKTENVHRVEGFVTDANHNVKLFIYGKYSLFLKSVPVQAYRNFFSQNNNSAALKMLKMKPSTFKKLVDSRHSLSDEMTVDEGNFPLLENSYPFEIPEAEVIFTVKPKPSYYQSYYNFSYLAMTLNQIEPGMISPQTLCPTDSRLRPDMRLMELGRVKEAEAVKLTLEHNQRQRAITQAHEQKWFEWTRHPQTNQLGWTYKGGYWTRNYANITNLFS